MRADYVFHYFSGSISKPTLIASSNRGAPHLLEKGKLVHSNHSQT